MSFFPKDDSSDGVYINAPLEEITEEQYLEGVSKFPDDIDWSSLSKFEFDDETTGSQELNCMAGGCDLP